MESNHEAKQRVGFIRISQLQWNSSSDAIKQNLSDGQILNVLQSISNGQYLSAVDVVLVHREFDEVECDGGPIVRYICEFFENPDGSVTRGPMIRDRLI